MFGIGDLCSFVCLFSARKSIVNLQVPLDFGVNSSCDHASALDGRIKLSAIACRAHFAIAAFRAALCALVGSRDRLSLLNSAISTSIFIGVTLAGSLLNLV